MTIAEHSEADAKSMFFRGADGRIAFYPHLYGYGYWVEAEGQQAALLSAARHVDRLSMIFVVGIFGALLLTNYMLPVELRPLPWLAWLPAMAVAAVFCKRRLAPHLAGLTRTAQRRFLLSRQSVAAMQSMSRLLFVLIASGLAAVYGAWQFAVSDRPSVAFAIAAGFGGVSLWAGIIILTKRGMQRGS